VDPSAAIQIIVLIILLFGSAFFSSAETALTTVNKIKMRSLAEEGNKKAKMVIKITEDASRMLSAILIGNNIVNLSASALTTTIAYSLSDGATAVAIATGIITLLILIFGEITPKTVATVKADKLALAYAYPIHFIMMFLTIVSIVVNALSRVILFILRVDPNAKLNTMTENELRTIVDVSHEDGVIEDEEKEMIYNVFDLGEAKAKDVMVPRVNVTFADVESSYSELLNIFREDKFTRLPVYEETTDNVIGTINMKDLLLYENTKDFHIRDILREAYFTHEHKSISELLVEMRQAALNIAIVLDEYGETAGLITLEDILEEIVGEIHDEYDENEEEFFKQISEYEFVVEGSMNLDDINDRVELNLESEDYDSLGGYIIEQLDRLPDEKDEIVVENGIRIVVDSLDKNRIEKVHIYLPEDFYDRNEDEEENED
jgi:CBS domain containing-hemolysin-like protein